MPRKPKHETVIGGLLAAVALAGVGLWAGNGFDAGDRKNGHSTEIVSESGNPDSGYSRAKFGPTWFDADRNGCDTRNDVLARDLTNTKVAEDGCTVLSGVLTDELTGKVVQFTRGRATSSAVQVDHRLALSAAWKMGAASWSTEQRIVFANDTSNLESMDGPSNTAKSDKAPSEWMPPVKSEWCGYATDWAATATKYELTVAAADQQVIDNAC